MDRTKKKICCICGKEFDGYGNNPWPYETKTDYELCCDECNYKVVIPKRIEQLSSS